MPLDALILYQMHNRITNQLLKCNKCDGFQIKISDNLL